MVSKVIRAFSIIALGSPTKRPTLSKSSALEIGDQSSKTYWISINFIEILYQI